MAGIPSPAGVLARVKRAVRPPATGAIPATELHPRARFVRDAIAPQSPRRVSWATGPVLNQGWLGACVAFACTGEVIAEPAGETDVNVKVANRFARNLYHRGRFLYSQQHDAPGSGEGMIAEWAMKVLIEWGLITEYRFAKSLEEIRDALIAEGPVVVALPWFRTFENPPANGLLNPTWDYTKTRGWHELVIVGYHPAREFHKRGGRTEVAEVYEVRNSWGPHWGERVRRKGKLTSAQTGNAWVRAADLDQMMAKGYWMQAVVPMGRQRVDLAAQLAAHPDPYAPPEPAEPTPA